MRYSRQRIAELEAELRAAKEVIEDLSDHGSAAERMKILKTQQAEIEQLNSWNQTLKQIVADDPEKHFYKVLLTRAADALENKQWNVVSREDLDLIAELRKAAK